MAKDKFFLLGKNFISDLERIQIVDSKFNVDSHTHNFIEIVYFEQGIGSHCIDGKTYEVKQGDIFMLDANVVHEYTVYKDNKSLQVKNLLFYTDFLDKDIRPEFFIHDYFFSVFHKEFSSDNHFIHINGDYNKDYLNLFRVIENELRMKNNDYLEVVRFCLKTIILKAFRDEKQKLAPPSMSFHNVSIITHAIDYIKENYAKPLTVISIAKSFNFSPNYFNTIFKTYTGTTLKKFIQNIRAEKARELLFNTDMSLEEISYAVGYSEYKSFFYGFKATTGISPNAYRKTHNIPVIDRNLTPPR